MEILSQRRPRLIFFLYFFIFVTRLIAVTKCLTGIKPKGKKKLGRDCRSGEPSGRSSKQLVTQHQQLGSRDDGRWRSVQR